VPDRASTVTPGGERGHQAERSVGAEGIERGETVPPLLRRSVVGAGQGLGGQRLEHCTHLLGEPAALGLRPALELVRASQIKAVEEWAAVQRHCACQVAALEGVRERVHVARDSLRIQPQFGRAEDQLGLVKIPAQSEARLPEEVTSVLGVALGPEEGDELVAARAILVRRGEQGEEGERIAPHGSAPTGRAVSFVLAT